MAATLSPHAAFGALVGSGANPRQAQQAPQPHTGPHFLPLQPDNLEPCPFLACGSGGWQCPGLPAGEWVAHTCYGLSSSALPMGHAPTEHPGLWLQEQAASTLTPSALSHERGVLVSSPLKDQGQEPALPAAKEKEGQRGAHRAWGTPIPKASWRTYTPTRHPAGMQGEAEPLTFRPPSWAGKDICKGPLCDDLQPEVSIPVDSPRANWVELSHPPAASLALCFLMKAMQEACQVPMCSEVQRLLLPPSPPPWPPPTPPSGAPQPAMNRSHGPPWGMQS